MSENFLSFIVNASPKAVDAGTVAPADTGQDTPQGAEFSSILAKEQSKAKSAKATEQPVTGTDTVAPKKSEVDADTSPNPLEADPQAPVDLPGAATNGNPLPELSIHSRALQVGRVILTTANPKVSEESLSQFARAQGGLMPDLKPSDAFPTATSATIRPTGSLLQGLVSTGEAVTPREIAGIPASARVQAASDIQVSTWANAAAPHSSLDARQRFMQQANLSGDMPAVLDAKVAGSKPEPNDIMAKTTDALAQTGQTRQAELLQQMKQANEVTNPDLAQAKSTLSTILSGQVEGLADRAIAGAEPLVEQGPSNQQSQSQGNPSAQLVKNAGSTLIQAPQGNAPVSLADVLLSSDPAQMQLRLQPYQVWAQRFGEVLAQKLALAVKEGNWTVKLNLNPSALGPVGIELQVGDRGIEGQIAANDVNVRQLLGDSMPRLRQSLEALVGEGAGVNIELSEGDDRRAKREDSQELELSMDLNAEELIPSEQELASGNILRDGLNVFV